MIPTLTTDRLTLGPFDMTHYATFHAFCATDRSEFLGGPSTNPRESWDSCMINLGQWTARGYGGLFITETATGKPVGRTALRHPIDLDEPELAWLVYADFEGQGMAQEAVLALRNYAYQTLGFTPLMSLIAPDNTRSVALAERLGCMPESDHIYPSGAMVIRYRHPGAAT